MGQHRTITRCFMIMGFALSSAPAICAASGDKLLATMYDVQNHFATCFRPPHEAEGSRITFYFSLKNDGEIYGEPRVLWTGFKGDSAERERFLSAFMESFEQCIPLRLNGEFASTIPGKVYYLQFKVGLQGSKGTEVMFRPYGSNGYPLVDVPHMPEHWW